MATTTLFHNHATPVENKALLLLINDIRSGKYRNEIIALRAALAEGNRSEADALKKSLPAFTPSGTFAGGRKAENLSQYSGFVHLDFDHIPPADYTRVFAAIQAAPYTAFCFRSPSGNGLKVFVEVITGAEHHALAYAQVTDYYTGATGHPPDRACKDITRLCYVSDDENLYKNLEAEKFPVVLHAQPVLPEAGIADIQSGNAFADAVAFTEKIISYQPGNRNNFIYRLACNCNRKGIPEDEALSSAQAQFTDLSDAEIRKVFRSAYVHQQAEFARFAKSANSANPLLDSEPEPEEDDYLKSTPTFPDTIFPALPEILREGATVFPDDRKRDVFLTSALSIISGCLPEVTGIYHQERVYPHLFTFVIAPAASGKGVMKNAKRLADLHHRNVLEASKEARKIYEAEVEQHKQQIRSLKKGAELPEKPEQPPFRVVFIPADCSTSRIAEHLNLNDGCGIICETEADTMSSATNQDWGNYSHMLRAAFQHEKIALSRKTNNEYTEILEPRLAVALSGTPAQVPRLIGSAEDGLFSRFLFYAFKSELCWQDPSPASQRVIYNDHFDALAQRVVSLIAFLQSSPTEVFLHPAQWAQLNSTFSGMLHEVATFISEDASSGVYRLGLMTFRMCMIFTALRKFENGEAATEVYCTDEDFQTALTLAHTFLQHSLLMFNNLPKQSEKITFISGDGKRRFFEALPQEFARKDAVTLGAAYQLATRTVDEILRAAIGHALEKIKEGHYRKT